MINNKKNKIKQMKFFKFAAAVLCGVFSIAAVSCDDDDNQPQSVLEFSNDNIVIAAGASADITVSGGTEPYTAISADEEIVTVEVSENIITVTGVEDGSATIRVADSNNNVGELTVTVDSDATLEFDKAAVSLAAGSEETVTVSEGTAPYSATSEDENIATATVTDDKVTITAVNAGTTTIIVTDDQQKTGTITVTVD